MTEEAVLIGVLLLRFLVPLSILRYPVPGLLAAIAADAIDGAVFEAFTGGPLANYQSYDKALDIYYLAIAYVAMLRNWTDGFALRAGTFLWYWRLAGVAIFDLTETREVLLLFPAAFEFFFFFYEAVRVRWWVERVTATHIAIMAAAAWALKLPQEYWVHVAQRSTTTWVKENVFGVDASASRIEAVSARPLAALLAAAVIAAAVALAFYAVRWLPRAHHPATFDANAYRGGPGEIEGRPWLPGPFLSPLLVEKAVLITLVTAVFAGFLPGVDASVVQITVAVCLLVAVTAAVSSWYARRGRRWRNAVAEFGLMCALNGVIVLGIEVLTLWTNASVGAWSALFYVLLLSLLISLYDRYQQLRVWRTLGGPAPGMPLPEQGATG